MHSHKTSPIRLPRLLRRFLAIPFPWFLIVFVALAIALSELIVVTLSFWLHGEVMPEYLFFGAVTSGIVASILIYPTALVLRSYRASQATHESAQKIAHIGHWETDAGSGAAHWSEELYRIAGIDPGRRIDAVLIRSLIDPDDLPLYEQAFSACRDRGLAYKVEYRIVRPDGGIRWIQCTAQRINDQGRKNARISGTAQDVTERKIAEIALEESQQRLILAGRAAYDLIYEWDAATDRLRWFGDIDRLVGLPPGTLKHDLEAWLELVHPDDRAAVAASAEQHRTDTDRIHLQYRVRHREGGYRILVDRALPLLDEQQKPCKWIGTCTDVTDRTSAEAALSEREALLRTVLDEIPDVILLKDYKGDFLLCNRKVAELYNTSPESMVGKQDRDFGVPEELSDLMRDSVLEAMEHDRAEVAYEDSRDASTGEIRHFRSIKKPLKDPQGNNQILVIAQDITDVIRAKEQAAESEARLRSILDNVDAAIYLKDTKGHYLFANKAVRELWNTEMEDIIGFGDEQFFDEATTENIRANDQLVLQDGEVVRTEEINTVAGDDRTTVYQSTKLPLRRDNGEIYALCGISVDITRQKEHQAQLEYVAHYDGLTHLPNRMLLAERMQEAMTLTLENDSQLAVVYLDLDGFKAVNDRYGHQMGDRLLNIVADRMKRAVRDDDTVARLGGDEFVAVLMSFPYGKDAERLLGRLLSSVSKPVHIDDLVIKVSASLGVSFYPQPEELDADQLLRQADQAMYLAKLAGKNRYHLFDTELDRNTRGQQKNRERIRRALDDQEFELHYQPKVNMRTGELVGAEALIRWHHPQQGLLLPCHFLPDIEDQPFAVELGEWVMHKALAQMEAWQAGAALYRSA